MADHDIFISYARNPKDEKIVKKIIMAIENQGLKVWFDKRSIKWGDSFPSEITDAIKNSQYILCCLSEAYSKSSWCLNELESAVAFQRSKAEKKPHLLPLILYGGYSILDSFSILKNIQTRIYTNSDEIASLIVSLGYEETNYSTKEWSKTVHDKKSYEYYNEQDSWLSPDRKQYIISKVLSIIPVLIKHRASHLNKLRDIRTESNQFSAKHIPAWSRLNVTTSEKGYRLIIGFRNKTCTYRLQDPLKIGCFNCGYYAGTGEVRPASISEIMQQFLYGFQDGFNYREQFDVIEFLGDGSFLNDAELSDKAKDKIFSLLAQIPYIKRVLVESTPEHVTSQRNEIEFRLQKLRSDQQLEIGIGLETIDNFIRKACINKGFDLESFNNAVKRISEVNSKYEGRCSIVVYILVKPAFLTTSEAIEDVINTLRYLSDLSNKYHVSIIPKLEPAVIPDGTILSLLFTDYKDDEIYYNPLNLWTVLEILTRAFEDKKCKEIFNHIRIGAREDMDDVLKVPATYREDGRYDQFDFILYDAIQEFNRHKSIFKIYAIIKETYPGGIEHLIQFKSSFTYWLNYDLKNENSSIASFFIENYEEIEQALDSNITRLEASFLKDTYRALDRIEGYEIDQSAVEKINEVVKNTTWPLKDEEKVLLSKVIYQSFHQENRVLFSTRVLDAKIEPDGFIRIFFEAFDFISGRKFPIWCGVPCFK